MKYVIEVSTKDSQRRKEYVGPDDDEMARSMHADEFLNSALENGDIAECDSDAEIVELNQRVAVVAGVDDAVIICRLVI